MLGATVLTIGGLAAYFRRRDAWGCECIQFYLTLSRTWQVGRVEANEVSAFRAAWQQSSVQQVVAHVSYLVDLASPDKEIRRKSLRRLQVEIFRASRFGARFLILHPGSFRESSREEGSRRVLAR